MRQTLRFAGLLAGIFVLAALGNLAFGWAAADDLRRLLAAGEGRPGVVVALVIGVLAIDSVLSVPTMATAALAGYLLGPWLGGLSAGAGVLLAGSICFFAARLWGSGRVGGRAAAARVRHEVKGVGPMPLLASRAAPMLPEILSALAGVSGMPFARYLVWFAAGNLPLVFAAAFAGSRSSLDRPWPALAVGLGLPMVTAAVLLLRRRRAAVA